MIIIRITIHDLDYGFVDISLMCFKLIIIIMIMRNIFFLRCLVITLALEALEFLSMYPSN